MSYTVYLPDEFRKELNSEAASGNALPDLAEVTFDGGVILAGKGKLDYGESRNQNLINLAANFASEEGDTPGSPDALLIPTPLVGQTWYDKTTGTLKVFDGTDWVAVSSSNIVNAIDVIVSPAIEGQNNVQETLEELATLIAAVEASVPSFTPVQQGGGTGQGNNKVFIGWSGSQIFLQVDSTNYTNTWPMNVSGSAGSVDGDDASFDSYLTITSSTVQGAIEELKDELDASTGGGPISASAITVSPTVLGQSNVQDALESLEIASGSYNWNLQAEGGSTTTIDSGENVNFTGSNGITVSRSGNTIDIDGSNTGQSLGSYQSKLSNINHPASTDGFVVANGDAFGVQLRGYVDGVQIITSGDDARAGFSFPVPAGSTYRVTTNNSPLTQVRFIPFS